ncbi:YkgJ family cysteine cluster protein [Desulfosarcina sp. OttesenSCG-928-A07]|nr:YkgJ family cysteine cluster protein [Desulfosarcina sp. OttesenSCG-928-A07]
MELAVKLLVLEKLFDIYAQFVDTQDIFCAKHCAHCCTANVTLTTLEGWHMVAHLEKQNPENTRIPVFQNLHPDRFIPQISINRMADICARNGELPEETFSPDAGPCPVLEKDICPVYAARPFGCRAMASAEDCGKAGCATLDPFILTVNNVFLQTIEHIDATGGTGNLSDVVCFLNNPENRKNYENDRFDASGSRLVPNQPVFVLMIPPEHRDRITPIMEQIRAITI